MSETVASELSGLIDTARRARARRAPVATGRSDDRRHGNHRMSSDLAEHEDSANARRLELGRELSAIHPHSYGWALACCRWERDTAEDVLHAAYLKVLDGKARFAGHASFRTWLFAVIRMTALETRRRGWRRSVVWNRYAPTLEDRSAATQPASSDVAKLRSELANLPKRQREVLHLVFYAELSIREAAEVMGVSLGTARTHYERGKGKLRVRLGVEV